MRHRSACHTRSLAELAVEGAAPASARSRLCEAGISGECDWRLSQDDGLIAGSQSYVRVRKSNVGMNGLRAPVYLAEPLAGAAATGNVKMKRAPP